MKSAARLLTMFACTCLLAASTTAPAAAQRPDIVLFDFESGTWNGWTVVDTATFGAAPTSEANFEAWGSKRLPIGYEGRFFASTGGARHETVPDGAMRSEPFTITRPYLTFLLAGELHPRVRLYLELDGRVVREAFGNNAYDLIRRGWDVSDLSGREVRLVVEDRNARRSLLRVDDIRLSDKPPPPLHSFDVPRRQESDLVRAGVFHHVLDSYDLVEGEAVYHATLVFGHDRRWHLYGSVGPEDAEWSQEKVRRIVHASAPALSSKTWTLHGVTLEADSTHGETFLWHPQALYHDGRYYLFYLGTGEGFGGWENGACEWEHGAWPATEGCRHGPFTVHLATSEDGHHWTRQGALFTDTPFAHTPYVTRVGEEWVMYYGAADPPEPMGKHAIAYRTSPDLLTWGERRIAFRDTSHTTPWPEHSFINAPVVLRRGDIWYLFTGPVNNGNLSRYHVLWPFRSETPFAWDYSFTPPHGRLFVDGAADIVRDREGQWYVTTTNAMTRGVWLAPLHWNDGLDGAGALVPGPDSGE